MEQQLARTTVKDLFERWLALELSQRKESSRQELVRGFQKDVLPLIGGIPAEEVTKAHIMRVLDSILARGARRLANRTLSELRQMFGFAYARDIIQNAPTHRLKKADIGGKETERDRVLSESEIRELVGKMPQAKLHPPTECAIWLMRYHVGFRLHLRQPAKVTFLDAKRIRSFVRPFRPKFAR